MGAIAAKVAGNSPSGGSSSLGPTTPTTFTQGSVLFAGAAGVLSQDNTNFYWDDTNNQLLMTSGFSSTNPAYSFKGAATVGFSQSGAAIYAVANGNTFAFDGGNARLAVNGSYQIGWAASDPSAGYNDTGFARQAAGIIRATDGSTGIKAFIGGGTSVASATALPLPTGRVFHVTGTTTITSITATNFQSGVVITLIFDGILTFTDGNNLKLAGNFVTTADDTITLAFDGTNFYEIARSVN